MKIQNRIYRILEPAEQGDLLSKLFDIFIVTLIILNTIGVMLETVESLAVRFGHWFWKFEIFSVMVFTIEYILRLWSCTANERFARPLVGRLKFAATPMQVIDLLAILPFYIPMIIPFDLRFLRVVRLFRIFRIFKLGRYSESLRILGRVLKTKKEELVTTFFAVSILLVIASSLMYYVEHTVQPAAFPNIPAAMWWGIVTLTTVGYGDVYPVTIAGKVLGAIIAVLGIGLFALPAGILASGFVEEIQKRKQPRICPYCGHSLDNT